MIEDRINMEMKSILCNPHIISILLILRHCRKIFFANFISCIIEKIHLKMFMVILISIIIAIKSTSRKIEILYFSEMNINKEDPLLEK